jgi:type IV pilus assembly protein PilY1
MKNVLKNTQWMCASLLVLLTCGSPAVADDTEILLINPNLLNPPQSNVMFIIDSSGSMGDQVQSKQLYDANIIYPNTTGGCDPDTLYWTELNVVPNCGTANTQLIQQTAFRCDKADARMNGIGSYSDSVIQFYGDGAGSAAWQKMQASNNTGIVECLRDRGVHGLGVVGEVWAQKGSTMTAYSSDSTQEIDWSGDNVSDAVTFYDGNYLNYRADPVTVSRRKIDIVQDVTTVVMNSIEKVNVGVMRFNDAAGGPVIQDIVDLETNRTAILAAINGINPGGRTPLSETLYEAARFWRGMPAYYGENINEHTTDPGALSQLSPEVYEQPEMLSCTKNFNVLLTDGEPNTDEETPAIVDTAPNALPNWAAALGHTGCTFAIEGDCLDDVAEYLFKDDVNTNVAGEQLVTTHTIGFAINLPVMQQAATASGGEYFLADDVESLTIALLQIVSAVQERSMTFTAPTVAVNSFNRTRNLNDLYLTTFGAKGKVHWPGNLKKYRITDGAIVDAAGTNAVNAGTGFFEPNSQSFWASGPDGLDVEAGGAASVLPAPSVRNVYTYNGSNINLIDTSNHISTGNAGAYTLADFGLTGAAAEPDLDSIILWALGEDRADEDGDTDLAEARNQMGDPLHSEPAAIVYGGSVSAPEVVVYTATNDGYVHAIDADTGIELWSFVPKEHLSGFAKLFFNLDSRSKNYGVDGSIIPIVKDVDNDGIIEAGDGDFAIIMFGMRRGGANYYALDVTDKNSPTFLWNFNDPNIGQSWSTPTVARVRLAPGNGQNGDDAVVIIGGGYDTAHDTMTHPSVDDGLGAGIYFLDLISGNLLWRAGIDAAAQLTLDVTGRSMNRAIPSAIRAIDLNGDKFADRMYATDLGGQVWRFDIFNGMEPDGIGTDALVTGGVVAQLGAEGNLPTTDAETRRFYNSPDVSLFNDNAQNRRFLALSVGSGYRAHPLDTGNTDRFYSIRDKNVFNSLTQMQYDALPIIKESNLLEVSGTTGTAIGQANAGWMFTLPANQKVLSDSATFNNEVFFVAFSPDPDNIGAASCAAGVGRNFLYRMSVINGDPIADLDNIAPGDEDASRVTTLQQGGIAPSPRFLFPSPDPSCTSDCEQEPIYCVGLECEAPGFSNNPVRTLWTQDGIE